MKTFSIYTAGCKVNQYETRQIRQVLESFGLSCVESGTAKVDLAVVNTCCITHAASATSRNLIHRARRLNPDIPIIVAGCLTAVKTPESDFSDPNLHIIEDKSILSDRLRKIVDSDLEHPVSQFSSIKSQKAPKFKQKSDLDPNNLPILTGFPGQTRAFLKVQDGCDGLCTYCIVPKTRSVLSSKPLGQVISEARMLVDSGHKEIVVTGIYLGAYGLDTTRRKHWPDGQNPYLVRLLEQLSHVRGLERIRLSSLEPGDVTDELLLVMKDNSVIMPHLHLPLQSGCQRILKKMARQYSVSEFIEKVALIRSILDRPAITTDIIVGFPSENDEDFQQTLDLSKRIGFSKIHVFPYSSRSSTAASRMKEKNNPDIIKHRSRILRDMDGRLQVSFRESFIGSTEQVLIESTDPIVSGLTSRYFKVSIENEGMGLSKNEIVNVKLTRNLSDSITGCPI